MQTQAIINLPKIVFAHDYHEFDNYIPSILNDILETPNKIKVTEVGFCLNKRKYVGIAYTDNMPSENTINKLLQEANVELN